MQPYEVVRIIWMRRQAIMWRMDNIEKVLADTPVPRVKGGLHRVILKRKLLAQMQWNEKPMAQQSIQERGALSLANASKSWRRLMGITAGASAAAVVAIVVAIPLVRQTSNQAVIMPSEPTHVTAVLRPNTPGVVVTPSRTSNESSIERPVERLHIKSLEQCVAEAQVIVVATALDFVPAPPHVPGDAPENSIRFRVTRILKGNLTQEIVTTRTPSVLAAEFIGRDWVVMLSPEYLAGKYGYADCYGIKSEPNVTAILDKAAR
jgi:hypothetical protein